MFLRFRWKYEKGKKGRGGRKQVAGSRWMGTREDEGDQQGGMQLHWMGEIEARRRVQDIDGSNTLSVFELDEDTAQHFVSTEDENEILHDMTNCESHIFSERGVVRLSTRIAGKGKKATSDEKAHVHVLSLEASRAS